MTDPVTDPVMDLAIDLAIEGSFTVERNEHHRGSMNREQIGSLVVPPE